VLDPVDNDEASATGFPALRSDRGTMEKYGAGGTIVLYEWMTRNTTVCDEWRYPLVTVTTRVSKPAEL
jgi:hypothetical protein